MDPYETLGRLITDAPGRTAAETALGLLRGLALSGDTAAANTIGDALARDLGVPPDSALPQLYRAGCCPADFLDQAATFTELSSEVTGSDLQLFQELVRRRAPLATEALRAYVLAALVSSIDATAIMGPTLLRGAYRLRIMDLIQHELRIVPGDAADHSFEFGRDFLLRCASTISLMGVIYHELGHHILESAMSSHDSVDAVLDHQLLTAVRVALPGLVSAAGERHDAIAPDDRRRAQCRGVTVLATRPSLAGGEYLHLSFSEDGGPIAWSLALPLARWAAEVLQVQPAHASLARSPRGIFHLGLMMEPDPSDHGPEEELVERSRRWYDALSASGRVGRVDVDIPVLLGLSEQPTRLHAAYEQAWQDQQVCDQLATGELQLPPAQPELGPALLAAVVRCGNPAAVAQLQQLELPVLTLPGDQPLVALGAGCCVLTHGQETALRAADAEQLWLTVEAAAAAGLSLDQPVTEDGQTLLTDAAARDGVFVRRLLATGAGADVPNAAGEPPLLVAVRSHRTEAAAALLDAGAAISATDPTGYTALHHAASQDSSLELLLGAGADPTAQTHEGRTPLMLARSAAAAKALLAAGDDDPSYLETADIAGLTALTHAAARCSLEVVQVLLQAGANPQTATDQGLTPLHYAARLRADLGACQVLDLLRLAGADVNEEADDGTTPLLLSTESGDPDVVRWLLESGADPDQQDGHGMSALIKAAQGWNEAIVTLLLEHGADPGLSTDDGETALQNARKAGHDTIVELLLAAGARV